ncbi:MAG: adenosylhomocysteinase [Microbacterium ginsengisoli]|uniref:adenosylhomocysteinase n=2 Tax=Microbacteriaceae TaxID=85023 RepID=UPI0006F8442D|nr:MULTISPECIES: adenosylhomocysteinase [unclassified Microbacterium]KQR92057.1 hypothetical protein ASF93_05485 [Microbacterium sp. Leaf347]MBN9197664.1 adenosylhomocysteinase [Microbacterium ginsengisoli]ODU77497.1 MAG: hypothetical protein ABT08_06555 [Microbacterium sp. SCN 71-21]OJU79413.1 MAG: hypothetical protein BGO15_10950 [Microbacterium sp. 71-23]
MDETARAERIVRAVALRTNALLAARSVHVVEGGASLSAEVRRLIRALGARDAAGSAALTLRLDLLSPHSDPHELVVELDGEPLVDAVDADARIDRAARLMTVSAGVAEGLDLRGLRVAVAMMLEPKTARLALLLRAAGAEVGVYAHPDETDADVAAALRARGLLVVADTTLSGVAERAAAEGFLRRGWDVLLDDGAHLIRLAHELEPSLVEGWIGACEETTSGLAPLRAMADAGLLRSAVMAVNDARTKTWFDNRYGTAQSCVFAVADLLDVVGRTVRDQPAVVVGYGPVGEGVAAVLRALGADVAVAEVDPVRALRALHDGFEVAPLAERAAGALVVSATGRAGTVPRAIAESSAVVAVAGGVPGEVDDLPGAEPVAPGIDRLPGGALLLGGGGAVNITAAEGNPIEIMDLSFAVQLAALGELLATRPAPGVHAVSATVDDLIARAALAARGVSVDAPDVGVARAADGWRSPRFAHRSGT